MSTCSAIANALNRPSAYRSVKNVLMLKSVDSSVPSHRIVLMDRTLGNDENISKKLKLLQDELVIFDSDGKVNQSCIYNEFEIPVIHHTSKTISSGYQRSSYKSIHNRAVKSAINKSKSNQLGIVGLKNLGNTCYMNASLQCLSNTVPLMDYFLGFNWEEEINRNNPIGTGGVLAEEFGILMKQMWDSENISSKYVIPDKFKYAIGKFHSQFSGNSQEDTQELLAFLLDGLHEDLNRVLVKPTIVYNDEEDEDCADKDEEILAIESWKTYLLRNRSIIVDLFQGQLRNVLKCLTCNYESKKFDPLMYLSLPIVQSPSISSLPSVCPSITDTTHSSNIAIKSEMDNSKMSSQSEYVNKSKRSRMSSSSSAQSHAEQSTHLLNCLQEFCKPEILSMDSQVL